MIDWKEFDEAVWLLQDIIGKQKRGSLSVNYGQQIGMALLYQSHRVLDLLTEMGLECKYNWKTKRITMEFPSCTLQQSTAVKGEDNLPNVLMLAITSDDFKKWRQAK